MISYQHFHDAEQCTSYTDANSRDDGYHDLERSVRESFERNTGHGTETLFTTNAGDLYELYLQNLPQRARQHYNCNACRDFVNRFGGLVSIDEYGMTHPVVWEGVEVPAFFSQSVNAVYEAVRRAKVTGVFVTSDRRLGTPVTGAWTHLAVDVPAAMRHLNRWQTAYQVTAEKAEDHRMLCTAVRNYRIDTVKAAVNLLRAEGTMYRGEKVLGVAEWFLGVLASIETYSGPIRSNLLWKAAATAPTGFCHVTSSMIGTLLDDIQAGLPTETVRRKFAEKMNPTQYQRPKAAPTVGNVAQAEKIVEKLGIANSLKRRFARLHELQTIWSPMAEARMAPSAGVFSGIATKQNKRSNPLDATGPAVRMTWEKFQRTVLPLAKRIEFKVNTDRYDNYAALVTAVDPDAPPILQWDTEDDRCPFNWYMYSVGSNARNWGLYSGYVDVTGVVLQPSMWRPGYAHQGKSVFFILKGCKDTRYKSIGGLALFPEVLKSELREIRSTIEAYSRAGTLEGYDEADACGIRLQSGRSWDHVFRVTTDTGVTEYRLDRWD